MHEFARRAGIYFGVVDPSPEDLAREPRPPRSMARRIVSAVVALTALAAVAYLLGGRSIEGAARYMLFAAFVLIGTRLWSWWQDRSESAG